MTSYRAAPPGEDTVMTYGPFEARWWLALSPLVAATMLTFFSIHLETSTFRGLECARPGTCSVLRGGVFSGVHHEAPFDPSSVTKVEKRRTAGKGARDQLFLLSPNGASTLLFEGPTVDAWREPIRRFFEDRSQSSLSFRVDGDPARQWIVLALLVASLVTSATFAAFALRASVRFRVSILRERGVLRIERVLLGRSRGAREVALEQISGVEIQRVGETMKAGSARERVVLLTREGSDVPVSDVYLRGHRAHERFAEELRSELGV